MPYDEDSNEDQNQLELTSGQMETEDPTTAEAPVKEEMGIAAAPENYQPATPRYVRADKDCEDSEDGQDTDEEGDIEAPYLAPKQTPAPKSSQDGPMVQAPSKEKNPPAEDSDSSGDDADPAPLQLLERQVDHLLMPPPSDTTPMAQKAPQSPSRDHQLPRMPKRRKRSPGTTRKKTLQERRNGKSLKLKVGTVAKMHTGLVDTHRAQELVKLTSAVVPLQRLKIQDDTLLEVQKNKPEADAPAPSKK